MIHPWRTSNTNSGPHAPRFEPLSLSQPSWNDVASNAIEFAVSKAGTKVDAINQKLDQPLSR